MYIIRLLYNYGYICLMYVNTTVCCKDGKQVVIYIHAYVHNMHANSDTIVNSDVKYKIMN